MAIDLNVDAALLLQSLVGIDSYPDVLALVPNIFRVEDRDRVHAVVASELADIGVLEADLVHPVIERWLHCLHRPDTELVARIIMPGPDPLRGSMLRMSLARSGDAHVLALRCDDHVVIQEVFADGQRLDMLSAALLAALGAAPALRFEPFTASLDQFATVPAEPDERRRALLELGAVPHTASALTRAMDGVVRRAEVLMFEHHDGSAAVAELCLSVLDTTSGRIVVVPGRTMDGRVLSTYRPGDDATVHAGVRALVDLLPSGTWFGTSRM